MKLIVDQLELHFPDRLILSDDEFFEFASQMNGTPIMELAFAQSRAIICSVWGIWGESAKWVKMEDYGREPSTVMATLNIKLCN